jgi:diadenosine tetraphosphate (Ap4A) HIT family hydrolase
MKEQTQDWKIKFYYDSLLIKEFKYWSILLRKEQVTFCSMVIVSTVERANKISDLNLAAFEELFLVFNYLEGKIQTSIKADKMNYLSLQMVDNFPHFHVFPRFKSKPQNDEFYPKPVLMNKFSVLDNLETDKILNHLKKL